jgi:rhamnulokinase
MQHVREKDQKEGCVMIQYYLAIDIGASSGRHMIGWLNQGKFKLEEVYRFENGMTRKNQHLSWDTRKLFKEILNGLKECVRIGKIPSYMGIDTWGVDFVLLDKNDRMIGEAVGYRDSRTIGMDKLVDDKISFEDLYGRTGIQKLPFNTIYQLMAIKTQQPEQLKQAKSLLMIPEYFNYLLTEKKMAEYTNATSTGLINAKTNQWDFDLIKTLAYPIDIFQDLAMPGASLGGFTKEIQEIVGFDCKVLLPATHDTGSAIVALPSNEDETLYLSSGTWSLMGVERLEADTTIKSRVYNFTNEGGYNYRYRYLKNIMGLWMIQELKRELDDKYSFAQLCSMASTSKITSIVDCQDVRFLAPESMIKTLQSYCEEKGMTVPQTPVDLAAVIYNSLAECYASVVSELKQLTGKHYAAINIIGGGSNADYLNKIIVARTGIDVYAGPTEATAIGNIAVQMLATGLFKDLQEVRTCIYHSFEIKYYKR